MKCLDCGKEIPDNQQEVVWDEKDGAVVAALMRILLRKVTGRKTMNFDKMISDVTVFLITQKDQEEMGDEERQIAIDEMGIKEVDFSSGGGVYKNKDDAIAVAKKLIANKGTRKLAVVQAIKG